MLKLAASEIIINRASESEQVEANVRVVAAFGYLLSSLTEINAFLVSKVQPESKS